MKVFHFEEQDIHANRRKLMAEDIFLKTAKTHNRRYFSTQKNILLLGAGE